MSHLDPYSGTEPRGWERSDRPPALPWPDREVEPWSPRQSGTDLSAVPQAPPRLPVRRHDESPDGPYDPPVAGRSFADDDAPTSQLPPVRDDDAPTAQLPPVRDDDAPTSSFTPVRDDVAARPEVDTDPPEPPPGRRSPGRRRASAARPATPQPSTGRAGRNLPAAIGVGLGLGALVLVPLFFFLPGFLAVLAGAIGVGIWEMARAVRRSGAHPPLVPLLAGGVLTIGLAWFAGPDALSLGLLVTVLGTMIWRLGDGPAGFQRDITAATLIAVYVPFLGGFAAMLAAAPGDGHLRVLVTVVGVVLSDTGGYAAGANFGKHPMAPRISPKKSWEGFAGSVVAAAAGSALLLWLIFDVAPWWGALFGVAVSVAAVLGDLAESMIKRDLGVKDMSSLLPGHGGLMDRLDSILFAVPTAYLLLAVLVPVVG
ncbi:phosphatidate cytidylyltransferase [Micromonospora wenchangensis]|uniref:phosphatidate cytidylyltransferase n=1 Tax=Micromonospora wenchangensis TaxID=1185415 RepID=UPI003827E1BF